MDGGFGCACGLGELAERDARIDADAAAFGWVGQLTARLGDRPELPHGRAHVRIVYPSRTRVYILEDAEFIDSLECRRRVDGCNTLVTVGDAPFLPEGTTGRAFHDIGDMVDELSKLPVSVRPTETPGTWSFTAAQADGATVTGLVARSGGELLVTALWVSAPEGGHVSATALRRISIERITDAAGAALRLHERIAAAKQAVGFAPAPGLRDAGLLTSRGRARLDDAYLERLAEAYLAEVPRGRGLYARLAATLGLGSPRALRNHLHLARQYGWLTPARPGSPGGEAGPALIAARERRAAQPPTERKDT